MQELRTIYIRQLRLTDKFLKRLRTILKRKSNTRKLLKVINTYVMPSLTYSFGIIEWTRKDLERLARSLKTEISKNRTHHKNSNTKRVTLLKNGGCTSKTDVLFNIILL